MVISENAKKRIRKTQVRVSSSVSNCASTIRSIAIMKKEHEKIPKRRSPVFDQNRAKNAEHTKKPIMIAPEENWTILNRIPDESVEHDSD